MTHERPIDHPSISVFGMGNVLMSDDAWGPWVVATLDAGWIRPPHVTLLDVGTPGFDLLPYITDVDALIIADTVHAQGSAGELHTYRREQILAHLPQPRLSPHEPTLKEALLTAELSGNGPAEVFLVGTIPATTGTGIGLSAPARSAIAPAIDEILAELARLGAPLAARWPPGRPDVWWEHRPGSPSSLAGA